jgi:hypothetical protein
MTSQPAPSDKALHQLRPPVVTQPLHNSIPPELLPRFDPVYVEYYKKYNAGRLHTHEVPIEEYRKNPAKYAIAYGRAAGPDVFRITQQSCPVGGGEIAVRIFEPTPKEDEQGRPKKRGVYINFHGGGWVFGSLDADHDFCKQIVHGLEGDVVAFDVAYRLAPEHRYPIPVDDCWTAFNWVCYHSTTPSAYPADYQLGPIPESSRVQPGPGEDSRRRPVSGRPSVGSHRPSLPRCERPATSANPDRARMRPAQRLHPRRTIRPAQLPVRVVPRDGVYAGASNGADDVFPQTLFGSPPAARIRRCEWICTGAERQLTDGRTGLEDLSHAGSQF